MEATATKKVISDKSAQAQKILSRKVVDVKKAQANDVDKEEPKVSVHEKPKVDEKVIAEATKRVAELKTQLMDATAALRKLTGKPTKSSEPKGPGVISSILDIVKKSGKKGVTKEEILAELTKLFPDRAPEGMVKTIQVQLPNRMSKEKNVKIEKSEDGKFSIK